MKALILAAGMATRLRPLTDHQPKCLLTVGGKTLLGRTVDALLQHAVRDITVVTGYRAGQIEGFLAEHYTAEQATFRFLHNADYAQTNNIYSLWMAMPDMVGSDMLLLDSDILFAPAIIGRLLGHAETTLALNRHALGDEEMKVVADDEGRVVEISKTCDVARAIGESMGIEKMNADYVAALARELDTMVGQERLTGVFYELAFERLIAQGHRFTYTDTTDLFSMELDTPDDFNRANELMAAHPHLA